MQAFDFETGLPKRCVKMLSWPLMDRLSRPFWDHLGRAALESFVPTKTTEGFLVMFDRSESPLPCFFLGRVDPKEPGLRVLVNALMTDDERRACLCQGCANAVPERLVLVVTQELEEFVGSVVV